MKLKSVFLVSVLALAGAVHADTLAAWDFESFNTTAPSTSEMTDFPALAASGGSGSFTVHHEIPTIYKGLAGNGSSKSLSAQRWMVGDYFQFSTSTLGHGGLVVSFDQQGKANGPRDFRLDYSTNGTTFTNFGNYTQTTDSWSLDAGRKAISLKSFDLSSVSALANKASVTFRLINTSTVAINGGVVDTSFTGGSSRLDNILVTAAPVPEPATMAALGLGVAAMVRRRRKA